MNLETRERTLWRGQAIARALAELMEGEHSLIEYRRAVREVLGEYTARELADALFKLHDEAYSALEEGSNDTT